MKVTEEAFAKVLKGRVGLLSESGRERLSVFKNLKVAYGSFQTWAYYLLDTNDKPPYCETVKLHIVCFFCPMENCSSRTELRGWKNNYERTGGKQQ